VTKMRKTTARPDNPRRSTAQASTPLLTTNDNSTGGRTRTGTPQRTEDFLTATAFTAPFHNRPLAKESMSLRGEARAVAIFSRVKQDCRGRLGSLAMTTPWTFARSLEMSLQPGRCLLHAALAPFRREPSRLYTLPLQNIWTALARRCRHRRVSNVYSPATGSPTLTPSTQRFPACALK
jgi:hypothetical protein